MPISVNWITFFMRSGIEFAEPLVKTTRQRMMNARRHGDRSAARVLLVSTVLISGAILLLWFIT